MSSNTNNSNAPVVNDSNSPNANKPNKPTSSEQKPKFSRTKSSKTNHKNKKDSSMTYNPSLEDDDYNVDNGRDWENLSRENLEEYRENDDHDIINPDPMGS